MNRKDMTDTELDALLAKATHPDLPDGFAARLQEKLEAPSPSNVVAFPQRQGRSAPARRLWLAALPLAASLAFGVYIGAAGALPDSLSGLGSSLVTDASDVPGLGIEDTESFINGDLS